MKVVVVTGGIGSGKSLVCSMLAEKGVPVYDSDSAARRLYDEDPQLLGEVVGLMGREILSEDGKVDRKVLAARVFGNPEALRDLESLVHPAVFRDFAGWKDGQKGAACVAYESAIALEKGLPEGFADAVVYVDAPVEERVARACARDGRSEESVFARVRAQGSSKDDPRVSYVIENDGTAMDLARKVDDMYHELIEKL